MWRQFALILLTVVSGLAIPKAGNKRELQRLVRLPRIDFPLALHFDRTSGFSVFPVASFASAKVNDLLKDAKGDPTDAPLHLRAARIYGSGGNLPETIRSYARAVDLFRRYVQTDPQNLRAAVGLAEALAALGRLGEAQSALQRAAEIASDDPQVHLGYARFYKEKAWTGFAGEENRFSNATFLTIMERMVLRGGGVRLEQIRGDLSAASEHFGKITGKFVTEPEFLVERACFHSFQSVFETAFRQIQKGERNSRELRQGLFCNGAIEDLHRAAERSGASPSLIAESMFASALADIEGDDSLGIWNQLSRDARTEVSVALDRLQAIAESGAKTAPDAAEFLGCAQLYLMKDFAGAERTFRKALGLDGSRERSWDLLIYSIYSEGDSALLVTSCEARSTALPSARSSAFLIKSYDRKGDFSRAEWTALSAATTYPHDVQINLSLAALLLKREDLSGVLWRAGDALNKAEKQMGTSPSRESRLQFTVLKSIYLALSDQPEQAKALLKPFAVPGRTAPEVAEVLEALDL